MSAPFMSFNRFAWRRSSPLAGLVLAGVLTGCSLAPEYQQPVSPLPGQWTNTAAQTAVSDSSSLTWQDFVTDPALKELIALGLANSRDFRQTLHNVQAVKAQYGITRADRFPNIALQGSGSRQRVPADLNQTGESVVSSTYQAGVGLTSFELDLFDRVGSLSEAALQDYLATETAAQSARIALIAEIIQTYLSRDSALRRYELTRKTLETREVSLELINRQREAGTTTALDWQEALGLVEQARADAELLDREVRQTNNALALLVGVSGLALPASPSANVALTVQSLQPGLPSSLLTRRPDIRAAEYTLLAKNANIGAARAAFFPSISLTGSYGSSSADLSNLFAGGQRSWSFAPQISLPIFSGGRNKANLELAELRRDIAVAQYELAIQKAFAEVSDALVAVETLAREEAARRNLSDSSQQAVKLSEARYRAGVDNHLRFLDAQRRAFTNEISLIETSTQRQQALVNLFKALGGGWQVVDS